PVLRSAEGKPSRYVKNALSIVIVIRVVVPKRQLQEPDAHAVGRRIQPSRGWNDGESRRLDDRQTVASDLPGCVASLQAENAEVGRGIQVGRRIVRRDVRDPQGWARGT